MTVKECERNTAGESTIVRSFGFDAKCQCQCLNPLYQHYSGYNVHQNENFYCFAALIRM